jgi:hypothetical protein
MTNEAYLKDRRLARVTTAEEKDLDLGLHGRFCLLHLAFGFTMGTLLRLGGHRSAAFGW